MNSLPFTFQNDIPPASELCSGQLSNGLQYYILPNQEPKGHVGLQLVVNTGSLDEADNEQGIAHFLEHIAFCGSEHFNKGDLIEYLQRMGVSFGHNLNACTGQEQTVYKLTLPNNQNQTLKDGLLIMRDYLTGLLIKESEIDRERGVILSELRYCDSSDYRNFVTLWKFLFPDSKASQRMPIGLESTIQSINTPLMRAFYERFYRPNNAALVIVGDIEPEKILPTVELIFGDITAQEIPQTDLGTIQNSGTDVSTHHDPELAQSLVSIFTVQALTSFQDSQKQRRQELRQELAQLIITRRLQQLSKRENSVFIEGEASSGYEARHQAIYSGIELTCTSEHIEETLKVAEQELRRMLQFGFTETETQRAKAILLKRYETRRDRDQNAKSDEKIAQIVQKIKAKRTPSNPTWDYEFAKAVLDSTTPDQAWAAYRQLWANSNRKIYISGNLPEHINEDLIRRIYRQSQRQILKAPIEETELAFAYENFGTPAHVIQEIAHPEIGITSYVLSNGVRVNLKPTDFENKQILIQIGFGQGQLEEPKNKPGLRYFAEWSWLDGGLGQHSIEDIQNLLAGKQCVTSFNIAPNAFFLNGRTRPQDFEFQVQLLTAYLSDAGYRPEGALEAQKAISQTYSLLQHTPQGVLENQVEIFLHNNDPRYGFPEISTLQSYTMDDVRQWLQPIIQQGYMEISIVGDIDLQNAITIVQQTLGTLPKRTGNAAPRDIPMPLPVGKFAEFSYESVQPKAVSELLWQIDDFWAIKETRCAQLLNQILQDRARERIRKLMGETYSPINIYYLSPVFQNYGYMGILTVVHPDKVPQIAHSLEEIAKELRENGFSDDEFVRAKEPFVVECEKGLRTNSWWLVSMSEMQAYPEKVERMQTILPFYQNIQKKDVEDSLRYLTPKRQIKIQILPKNDEKTEQ